MASRVNVMKMLQTAKGAAEVVKPQPQLRPPLSPLRTLSYLKRIGTPKRKLTIPVNMRSLPDIPTPVVITHLPELTLAPLAAPPP